MASQSGLNNGGSRLLWVVLSFFPVELGRHDLKVVLDVGCDAFWVAVNWYR